MELTCADEFHTYADKFIPHQSYNKNLIILNGLACPGIILYNCYKILPLGEERLISWVQPNKNS